MTLPELLKRARDGRAKAEMGRRVGVRRETWGAWESGRTVPDWLTIQGVGVVLGLDQAQLLAAWRASGGAE